MGQVTQETHHKQVGFKTGLGGKIKRGKILADAFRWLCALGHITGRNKTVGRISQRRNPTYSLNKLSDYGAYAPNLTYGYEMKQILDSLP